MVLPVTGPTTKFWTNASTIMLMVRDTAVSLNDVTEECGLGYSTVRYYMRVLADFGLLTLAGGKARAWKLTPAGQAAVRHLRIGHERRIITLARPGEACILNKERRSETCHTQSRRSSRRPSRRR